MQLSNFPQRMASLVLCFSNVTIHAFPRITRPIDAITVTSVPVKRFSSFPIAPWHGMLWHVIVTGRGCREPEHSAPSHVVTCSLCSCFSSCPRTLRMGRAMVTIVLVDYSCNSFLRHPRLGTHHGLVPVVAWTPYFSTTQRVRAIVATG